MGTYQINGVGMRPSDHKGNSTRAVHGGEATVRPFHALVGPIFQTATYTFDSMAEAVAYQTAHLDGRVADRYEYGRYGNPTIAEAEARVAALEYTEAAVQVASGMAAVSGVLLALLAAGDHVILTDDGYRRSRQLLEEFLAPFQVECTAVPCGDYDAIEAEIRPNTRLIFSETPTNPYLRVLDLERFASIGRRHDIVTAVDATFATPMNVQVLAHGVDLVIHSATKYLGGHNDLLAGVVAGRRALVDRVRTVVGAFGSISDPHSAFLLLRGLKTLALRVRQHNANGQAVAMFLESHPFVEEVWYPGLASHVDHALARRQMSGFGGVVTFAVRGDQQATFRFLDALRVIRISPSLGGVESLALHPASMAYPDLSSEERRSLGIEDNLVRLALGIEDSDDLIGDIANALALAGQGLPAKL